MNEKVNYYCAEVNNIILFTVVLVIRVNFMHNFNCNQNTQKEREEEEEEK